MKRRLTAEELQTNSNYSLLRKIRFDELLNFVLESIRYRTPSTWFFLIYNSFSLLSLAFSFIHFSFSVYHGILSPLKHLSWGLLCGSILIIPVHELIHGITYLIIGARKIHFGADLKQMLFYVSADKFVTGRKNFIFVALSPFVIINIFSILILFFVDGNWNTGILSFLFFHNIMCIGDFAMVSFFQNHWNKELYTFDDLSEMASYIYRRDEK